MPRKVRLDALLVERGLAPSRAKAQAMVRAGEVDVDGQRRDKPGMPVGADATITVRARPRWVGRGALKLEAALDAFGLDVDGRVCLDVGASTGGFTELLLARGARRVYAVDVGRNQLAWRLRSDERVISMERTDVRAISALPEAIERAVVDVSFISLALVLPAVARLVEPGTPVVALVKPQFEAGRQRVGRRGVVRDEAVRREAVGRVLREARAAGWRALDALPSPIEGARGNREALVLLRAPEQGEARGAVDPELGELVERAMGRDA